MNIAPLHDEDYVIPSSFPQLRATHRRNVVTVRKTHAPHQQTCSTAVTYISRYGALPIRFPSDKIVPGDTTLTKEEYESRIAS